MLSQGLFLLVNRSDSYDDLTSIQGEGQRNVIAEYRLARVFCVTRRITSEVTKNGIDQLAR